MITDQQLEDFCKAVDQKLADHFKTFSMTQAPSTHSFQRGKKYVRIIAREPNSQGGSAFCFVDAETGDIYKSAGWSAPAKHVRGNIANGAADVGPYGAAYLR